ncbi:MAG TPA: methyltransferase [Bacteroidales bacterium]|nr:methyltransferase [Bacteroidales bacterium]
MPQPARKQKLPPLFVIKATIAFRNFLLKMTGKMLPASYVMLEEVSKLWKVKALEIAANLDIAGLLKDGPQNVEKLAGLTSSDTSALYRVLRALAGEGIFRELPGRVFKNTRLSLAISDQKESVRYFAMHHIGKTNWELTGDMPYCVAGGKDAFSRKFNSSPFEYLKNHPGENDVFNKAMTETAALSGDILVSSYPFGKFKTIVDVGGGQGLFLAQILTEHPGSEGILVDQPHVAATAMQNFISQNVDGRCKIIEGSFFETIHGSGDLYIMKNILHDWDDETAVLILKNLHKNMPAHASLLLIETIIKADNKPSFGKFIDLQMLIGTQGGRERTLDEYSILLNKSGFVLSRIIENATPFSFIEASKSLNLH